MSVDRTQQPEIYELDEINILKPQRSQLPGGVSLNIISAGTQDVVRLDLVFKAGNWQQSQKLQALFTNRMLREGTANYTSAEIAEKLDFYGAWLELTISSEHAFVTLYSLNKYFSETVEILNSIITEPVFPEKELNTIVEMNIQQYKVNCSKVDFVANRSLLKSLFGDKHPCGQFSVEEDYRKINRDVLIDFYQTHYRTDNCSVFLAGKVTKEIVDCVEQTFGQNPFGKQLQPETDKKYTIITTPEKRIFTEHPDALQSAVKLGAITIHRTHPDYMKLRVLITLFGGYFGSRLMSNIREDKGYTYGISAGIFSYPDTSVLLISTETANEFVDPLIREVYYEIDRLHNEPVSEEELSIVRNYMLGEMYRSYESAFSLSDAWIFIDTSHLEEDYFSRLALAVKEITPDEIQRLSRQYLCKENLKEIIVGKNIY